MDGQAVVKELIAFCGGQRAKERPDLAKKAAQALQLLQSIEHQPQVHLQGYAQAVPCPWTHLGLPLWQPHAYSNEGAHILQSPWIHPFPWPPMVEQCTAVSTAPDAHAPQAVRQTR